MHAGTLIALSENRRLTEAWETQTAINIAEELNSPQTTLKLKNLSKTRSDAVNQSKSMLNQKLAELPKLAPKKNNLKKKSLKRATSLARTELRLQK